MTEGYRYAGTGQEDLSRSPGDIAQDRCSPLVWAEQLKFMRTFNHTRDLMLKGKDTYLYWRSIQADATLVAGYLEGVASIHRERGKP